MSPFLNASIFAFFSALQTVCMCRPMPCLSADFLKYMRDARTPLCKEGIVKRPPSKLRLREGPFQYDEGQYPRENVRLDCDISIPDQTEQPQPLLYCASFVNSTLKVQDGFRIFLVYFKCFLIISFSIDPTVHF